MSDEVTASLIAEFKSTGVSRLLDDYKKVHTATKDLGDAMDAVAGKQHAFWNSLRAPTGLVGDLKAVHTAVKDVHTVMGQSAPTQFANSLHSGITQAESAWDRLVGKIKGGLGGINLPGANRGGFDILGSLLGVASGPLGLAAGAVGNVAGAGLGLIGGGLGLAGGAAGAGLGFAAGQVGSGITDIGTLDAGRAAIAAHMGTDFSKLSQDRKDAILAQVLNNAFLLSSAPETGKVNSEEALAAMDEAAKAGITDPQAMMDMAKTALQLRAAGGESKITTDNAMRLLITGKNAFGGKYNDLQVANAVNGLVNATTLDIGQIQSILKNAGAANISGMSLDQYLLDAGMMAQAGVNPGQIGGGIKQMLQMSQPRTATSMAAMEALGLVTTETHREGGTAGTPEYWETLTDPLTGKQTRRHHAATKGTAGTEVTTLTDNKLWDAQGNIADPAAFFAKLLKGTAGMTNEQTSKLVSDAFNPKAAGYIEQILGYYRDNPQAFEQLAAQMKQQSDVAATAATQNNNLQTGLQNLGDTVQNLKDKALLPLLGPLNSVVNQLTGLGQDALKGDWGAFKVDLGKLKGDLTAKLTDLKTWLTTNAPKIFEQVKGGVLDVAKILFGDNIAAKVQGFFDKDLPAAWNGATATLKGLKNLWDTTLRPLLLGTDQERTTAVSNLTGMVGSGIDQFLNKDLPQLLDRNKNGLLKAGEDIGTAIVNGVWNGFKKTDIGSALDALGRGDFATFTTLLNKHGVVGMGGDAKAPDTLPAWLGGGQIAGTGPKSATMPAQPPPGRSGAGHYTQVGGMWVWVADDPTAGGSAPPPPSARPGARPDNVGAGPVQVVIQTHPGDTNRYSVPTVAQRHSQDAENYGRLSRPRS